MGTTKSPTFAEKLYNLAKRMFEAKWEKDAKNKAQGYRYISDKQYKAVFKAALLAEGLRFQFEPIETEFIPAISDKMHLIKVKAIARIIDPSTGEKEELSVYGTGADMGDKAYYKAITGAVKYYLSSNYLVAEDMDPENDEIEAAPKYVTPEKREEVKKEMLKEGKPATKVQVTALKKLLEQLLQKDDKYEDVVNQILESTNNLETLTKEEAEEYILAVGEILEGEE